MPDYLRQYASDDYIKTGTLQEPDYETIAAADADLMIVAGRSRAKLGELAAILPTIDLSVDNRNLVEGVKHNITTFGDIFGKQARAAELNAAIDAKFAQLREAAQHNDSTAIVLVTNAGKLGVYGTNSRVSWIFTETGFRSVDTDVDDRFHGGDAVSFEYLLEADPDWLFVIDRDAGIGKGGAAQQLLDNALMHQTKAWKQQHIVYLDPMDAYTVMHGYRSIMRLADQVLAALAAAN
ncbi:siderophore ABC transporter substrate-binding protein [Lampropedia cohaerens]|uniref:siderophore ABC transporter substrate-binding protein n=1 Tax=Lampropedia cohaerens TaxID=1610491 RepID=UPI0018D243DB